jgi:hypothetical protein
MKKILVLSFVIFAFSAAMFAQATTQATATATIVIPMTITKTVDLNFGSIVPNTGGTVVITPAGARSATGTVVLFGGVVSAASFNVTGSGTSTYAITLPTTDHTITSGGNTMTVNNFQSNPSGTGALVGGAQTLTVGATLNVGSGQAVGTYTNAAGFDVTVNYN